MYERLKDKKLNPSFEYLIDYCGTSGNLWLKLEEFLFSKYNLVKNIHNSAKEGWGVNYKHDKIQICDIHAETDAFVVFFQIHSEEIDKLSNNLSEVALSAWANRYPCGKGGWIKYRVTKKEHLADIEKLLLAKVKPL